MSPGRTLGRGRLWLRLRLEPLSLVRKEDASSSELSPLWGRPLLLPKDHPLAGVSFPGLQVPLCCQGGGPQPQDLLSTSNF